MTEYLLFFNIKKDSEYKKFDNCPLHNDILTFLLTKDANFRKVELNGDTCIAVDKLLSVLQIFQYIDLMADSFALADNIESVEVFRVTDTASYLIKSIERK